MSTDYACFATPKGERLTLLLQIEGMFCAACAFKIEAILRRHISVEAHINYSTQRLSLSWPKVVGAEAANSFVTDIETLGYRAAPFEPDRAGASIREHEKFLMTCMAVAGFATGNIMLFSQAVWFNPHSDLNGASLDLMHWVMAMIAMPVAMFCGQPFFRSAFGALRHGRTNMDVPISIAILLTNALSLFETLIHGHYVYFDASVMLLFFLLVGRYLDVKARGRARDAAAGLMALMQGTAEVRDGDKIRACRINDIKAGEILIVKPGERIAVDARLLEGEADIDTSAVTGESVPRRFKAGEIIYGGMINLGVPLNLETVATASTSLVSEIIALMEKAEQGQAEYVRLADRISRMYAPIVHILAAVTFGGWLIYGRLHSGAIPWEDALLKAMAVLIITCPCALGLAVPVVQVIASAHLFRKGILLKSGKGLETLAQIDTIVFDKTGTLTQGKPSWANPDILNEADQALVLGMVTQSLHPLSKAVAAQLKDKVHASSLNLIEHPGRGLEADWQGERLRLGSRAWVNPEAGEDHDDAALELYFQCAENTPQRLVFADQLRPDAKAVIAALKGLGIKTVMLSGDREAVAHSVASDLGMDEWFGSLGPLAKIHKVEAFAKAGQKVCVVGDGLNDAGALSAAFVSMSPASAIDITQNAADIVYRGEGLGAVLMAYETACAAQKLVKHNFILSLTYNAMAIPAAMFGLVTPLIAALAMSGSSLMVIGNAFRLKGMTKRLKA